MAVIHFVLQGKGGVGKSLISALLMQHQQAADKKVIAVDTDPVNASFSSYSAFAAKRIELLDAHQNLQAARFDDLMQLIIDNPDSDFIIDNGASSFLPLSTYLTENQVIPMLSSLGHCVVIHTVITGGQAMMDTLHGFASIAKQMNVLICVWLNAYFGEIQAQGKQFYSMKVYESHKDKVVALIHLEKMSQLFEQDFQKMIGKHLTFAQAQEDGSFNFMAKNRLNLIQKGIYEQLDTLTQALNDKQS